MTTVDSFLVELLASPPPAVAVIPDVELLDALEYAVQLGEGPTVAPLLADIVRHAPHPHLAHVLQGQVLIEQGQHVAARAPLRAAIGQHPLDPIAWAALGATFPAAHPAAAAAFRRAALHAAGLWDVPLEPRHVEAVAAPAAALQALREGQVADALDGLARQVRRQPARRDLRLYYAEALRRAGRLADARALVGQLVGRQALSLPLIWLLRALDPGRLPPQILQQQAASDPGDRLAQRFFAPDPPPWQPTPSPDRQLASRWQALLQPFQQQPAAQRVVPQAKRANADPQVAGLIATASDRAARISRTAAVARTRPRVVSPAAEVQHALLITASDSLRRAIGADGTRQVLARLATLCQALTAHDRPTALLDISHPEALIGAQRFAALPFTPEPGGLVNNLRRLAAAQDALQAPLGTVLLIGGDGVVPFVRLPNTVPDGDLEIPSDLPYGCDSPTQVVPRRVVARLPDGGSAEVLLGQIEAMLARHSRAGAAPRRWPWAKLIAPASVGSYSAAAWRHASAAVLAHAGLDSSNMPVSPPGEAEQAIRAIMPAALLYCNLHGAIGSANWYGQPEDGAPADAVQRPIACTPAALAKAQLAGTILVSEACYGMELGSRAPDQSIPLTLLRGGGSACVGTTVNAYGTPAAPLVAADLLAAALLRGLAHGQPVGEALQAARAVLVQEMEQRQGYLDEIDLKTLNSFVLYGDPWAAAVSAAPAPTPKSLSSARPERRGPTRMVETSAVAPALMRQVRQKMAHLVSPQATLVIRAAADGPAGAKDGDGGLLTFSAHDVNLTPDGYYSAQAAHVTVRDGQIVKTVVSR
jgi:Tfp pilus assembly protein PilF